ncbi:MAG: TolC family outer membrane protein [Sphingomonadaceae bacterium]|nr:TolC family outer membrane protein [Sphingomonadaceae bacterium]
MLRLSHTLCVALLLGAAWVRAENLSDIYRLALANDPQYAAAREAYRAGLEKLPQARAGLLPSLSLTAFARNSDTEVSGGSPSHTSNQPYGYALALTQPIYRKQNLETLAQAQLQVTLAEQQLKLAGQDLMLRAAQAYFELLQAQDDLAQAQAQRQAFAEQLKQARRAFEVGAATIVDSHEAQARHDLALAQEIAAANTLEVKRRALERLIGRPAPRLAPLKEPVSLPLPDPPQAEHWERRAEQSNLNVLARMSAHEIARREVERQRGGHYPTLDLTARYDDTRRTSTLPGGSSANRRDGVIGLEINLPLYQGGGVSARVREAVANLEKARYELDDARRTAALAARQSYLGVVSGAARVKALEQALVSSDTQLRSTKLGLEVGVRTRVDVLNAEQQRYTTLRDLAAARYQVLLAGLQLKAAAGSLDEADLKAIDALLADQP